MTEHKMRLEIDQGFTEGDKHFIAMCSCGWESEPCTAIADADKAAIDHHEKKSTIHNVAVVPAKDGRQGLYQAVCSCNFEGPAEFQSKANRRASNHNTAMTQNQA